MVRILIPSGALGLGYDAAALDRGIANAPDLIAIDGGSTDSGPSYLGRGVSKYARATTRAEWAGLVHARARAGVPLVIGTAGTCGAGPAVDWMVAITREVLAEAGLSARLAILKSDQPKDRLKAALAAGRIHPLDPAPALSDAVIDGCTHIVALAGAEQIAAALRTGADIVIAGRTTDTAIIAALPLMRGCDPGAAWHGAKIAECGALCATNPQSGVLQLDVDAAGFTVTPLADGARATPHTVSAHMLYENADPFRLTEPGGHLDVSDARYDALDDRPRAGHRIALGPAGALYGEAGRRPRGRLSDRAAGAVARSPLCRKARDWVADIVARCTARAVDRLGAGPESFTIELRLIGLDATLGALETRRGAPVEVGVLGDRHRRQRRNLPARSARC
jgi:hypothetical protein